MKLSREMATQLAIMLQSGMPSSDAVGYFGIQGDLSEIRAVHDQWMKSDELRKALLVIQGKPWQELALEDKIDLALKLTYAGYAYFLYSHNYTELTSADKAKADTARVALETKQAGMAGKTDALSRFFADITSGAVKLGQAKGSTH